MKVLFDTNVILELEESGKILSDALSEMVRLARMLKYEIVVHPKQVEDFQRDKNALRREVHLSRLRQYPELDNPPLPPPPTGPVRFPKSTPSSTASTA